MKKITLILLACALTSPAWAADLSWLTSVPEAEVQAKKERKLVLLNFTGSDWCAACKVLDAEVFFTPAFTNYAKSNLVLVELDYPLKKQPAALEEANAALQTKYKIDGYPTLIVLTPDDAGVWTNRGLFNGGVNALIATLDPIKRKYLP